MKEWLLLVVLLLFGAIKGWSKDISHDSISVLTLTSDECFLNSNFTAISHDLSFPSDHDSLKIERVLQLVDNANTKNEKFKANLFAGLIYKASSNPTKAIYFLRKCSKFEDAVRNKEVLYVYCMNLGKLHSNMELTQTGIDYLRKAEKLAIQQGNLRMLHSAKVELGVAFLGQGRFEEAKKMFQETLSYAESESSPDKQCYSHFYLSSIGFCQGDTMLYDYHRSRLKILVNELNTSRYDHMLNLIDFKEVELRELSVETRRSILIRVFKSCRHLNDLYNLQIAAEYLSSFYEEIEMKDSALYFLHVSDSIDTLISSSSLYNELMDMETQKTTDKKTSKVWILWVGGCFIVVGLVFLILYKYSRKKNEENLNTANDTIERLSSEIQEKDASISQLLTQFRTQGKGSLSRDTLQELALVTNERIDSFQNSFELEYPGFIDYLKTHAPNLNANDINVIILCILKVDSAEQARILGVAPSSLRIRRYRMKKKLHKRDVENIPSFSHQVFTEYLSRLS